MSIYINDVSAFLPNSPVDNDGIENVLGRIADMPSRTKKIVLRSKKIDRRYYALDPSTGELTHTNWQLTAEAIRKLNPYDNFDINHIKCLCCGTTCPDLLFPGHALMVLGELGLPPCEAITTAGICLAGMTAFKYAYMNVATGMAANAVATGSELASSFMRAHFFISRPDLNANLEQKPIRVFDADFLRWMLSDGAGAVFISKRQNEDRISLRIEWLELISYAGELETCMYGGGIKNKNGAMIGWRQTESIDPSEMRYLLSVRQDIKLLDREIVQTAMHRTLARVVKKYGIKPEDIDWYLPHYSSHYFRDKFYMGMKEIGFEIPYEKWFTNLPTKGNTGSAAIYIIMEELFHSEKLEQGQKLLCFIPESGRFSHCFMLLTVV